MWLDVCENFDRIRENDGVALGKAILSCIEDSKSEVELLSRTSSNSNDDLPPNVFSIKAQRAKKDLRKQ